MSNNVSDMTEVIDNVSGTAKRGRGRPRKSITNNLPETIDHVPDTTEPEAYFGKGDYVNVALYIDQRIYKAMKIMAIRDDTSLKSLINEALLEWMKWLHKAARSEAKVANKVAIEKSLKEIEAIVKNWRGRKYAAMLNRMQKRRFIIARRKWKDKYPGMPLSEYKKRGRPPNSVPDTTANSLFVSDPEAPKTDPLRPISLS